MRNQKVKIIIIINKHKNAAVFCLSFSKPVYLLPWWAFTLYSIFYNFP